MPESRKPGRNTVTQAQVPKRALPQPRRATTQSPQSNLTTNLPTNAAPSTKTVQTDEHAFEIEAEALAIVQRNNRRWAPPVARGTFPYENLGWIDKLLKNGRRNNQDPRSTIQRVFICWKCYAKGHMATHCTLDYDTRSGEVICNYEFLTFEEMGQVPPGAYFRLKQWVTAENAKSKGLIQLVSCNNGGQNDHTNLPRVMVRKPQEN
eukprot:IDg4863t1